MFCFGVICIFFGVICKCRHWWPRLTLFNRKEGFAMAVEHPEQRTALVTGVTAGIGEEIARRLLRDGFKVYVGAPAIHTVVGLFGAGAIPLALDVSSEDDIIAVVERIREETGGIDVLVNITGIYLREAANDILPGEARDHSNLELFGLTRLVKLLLPCMRKRGKGRIVNMSPVTGIENAPLDSQHHVNWHALEGWSECLRIEAAPFGIDVTFVGPSGSGEPHAGPGGEEFDGFSDAESIEAVARACGKPYEHDRLSMRF
jgi:NAD(P)-dependent dehydrogenase (short-subunit alcohol dehydrogenase family)